MARRRSRRPSPPLNGASLLLLLLLLGLFLFFEWWQNRPQPTPVAAGGVESYFMPEDGKKAKARLIALMSQAKAQLDVAAFEFRDLEIARALLDAARRGVAVRLYSDRDYQRETREYIVRAAKGQRDDEPRLTHQETLLSPRSGVGQAQIQPIDQRCERVVTLQVCYDRREAFMHHKFVIPDELGVWTGSTNLTWNAFARNNENSLWLPSAALAKAYRAEFDALWGGLETGRGQPARFAFPDLNGTVYFSPEGGRSGRQAILKRLREARREIWIAAFVLTDNEIVRLLEEAVRREVKVRAVLETRNLVASKDREMQKAGVEVRRDANPYTLHDKVMVLDREWVITGSYNFSNNAFRDNNENLLILQSQPLAQRYAREVEAIWKVGKPLD
ncbi:MULTISPECIES: phospholipase D-like domain-containing protein [unclassified Meiothermus]|uniref:phospholipase D-like domain-containing protein n=1 Tax=unclassified Meiothermus TaxID=370471 RepID=UPI000D7B9EFF|nr:MULTISPECIES: phospholipase D-like domain-containing protein [unclassified Meiothermus]PZA06744.1 phospholipase [Meiothermus sp. Pnk-1]RYM36669.1 phospholipase [Meiothermus sp. PNK-Is4]